MAKNSNLHAAKTAKNDEFYTQLTDVEKEMKYYRDFFRGKKVLCNCNDDQWSAFFKYFSLNFEFLGLKKLTCVSYNEGGHGKKYVFEGDKNGNRKVDQEEITITELNGCGDFSDDEGIAELIDCDVVVTNPPFSLFRDFVALLMKYNKKFLIIGNGNAVTYKEIFPLIKENNMWMGVTMNGCQQSVFIVPDEHVDTNTKMRYSDGHMKYTTIVNTAAWFTNIDHNRRHQPIDLYKKYNVEEYPKYDNYDAIECGKVAEIPMDYDGVIGVPISYIGKHCPEQFEIIDINPHFFSIVGQGLPKPKQLTLQNVGKKDPYARILIRRKV